MKLKKYWNTDISLFVVIAFINTLGVINYEERLKPKSYFSYEAFYDTFLIVCDDFIGCYSGIVILYLVALIFLFLGIKKILKNNARL